MERLLDESCDPRRMGTAALAFMGDAVYSMLVREHLCCRSICKAGKLHSEAVAMVCCESQAAHMLRIMDMLTDEERAVYMRGRNTHTSHVPKNSGVGDYRSATGLEALFGFLYLDGQLARMRELFERLTEGE